MAGVGDACGADCGFADDDDGTVLAANANPLKPPDPLDTEQEPALSPKNDGPAGLGFLNVPGLLRREHRHSLNLRPR